MTRLWHCWPKVQAAMVSRAARHTYRSRPLRHARRVAAAAISKPGLVAWTCVSLWWPTPLGQPAAASIPPAVTGIALSGDIATWGLLPFGWEIAGPPVDVTPTPTIEFPFAGPPTLLPELPIAPESIAPPTQRPVQVPEPCGSVWWLLTAAIAGLLVGRKSYG